MLYNYVLCINVTYGRIDFSFTPPTRMRMTCVTLAKTCDRPFTSKEMKRRHLNGDPGNGNVRGIIVVFLTGWLLNQMMMIRFPCLSEKIAPTKNRT